jgi:hypothetical protein
LKNEVGAVPGQDVLGVRLLPAFDLVDMYGERLGTSVSGSGGLIIITLIGEPSDSNWNSYVTALASVAMQATLDTCCVAKFPICLHDPLAGTTDGTGNPSSLGRSFDFKSIWSIDNSNTSWSRLVLSPENVMMWLSSSGSLSGTVKLARPPGLWKNATEVQTKSRSATFTCLHLPAIDAYMSMSGSCRSVSSAMSALEAVNREMNAAAIARQHMRMKNTSARGPA